MFFCYSTAGPQITVNGKECLNLATFNFLGLLNNQAVKASHHSLHSCDSRELVFCFGHIGVGSKQHTKVWCRVVWSKRILWHCRYVTIQLEVGVSRMCIGNLAVTASNLPELMNERGSR